MDGGGGACKIRDKQKFVNGVTEKLEGFATKKREVHAFFGLVGAEVNYIDKSWYLCIAANLRRTFH